MQKMTRRGLCLGAAAAAVCVSTPGAVAPAWAKPALTTRYGFNDEQIAWRLFDAGASEAAKSGNPIFFLAHATWCYHCLAYRKLFFDAEVVRLLEGFVPVLVDADAEPEINTRFALGKAYVPRTMFLNSNALLQRELHLNYPEFVYFVDYVNGPKDLKRLLRKAKRYFEQKT